MAYTPPGVTVVQNFSSDTPAVLPSLLPMLVMGPAFHIETRTQHATPVSYVGLAVDVDYPNLPTDGYVDMGDETTWEDTEESFPVEVYLLDGKKAIASHTEGYYGSAQHYAANKVSGGNQITGFPSGTFNNAMIGRTIYIHTATVGDRGSRTITGVSLAGDSITVSGAVFGVSESANLSLIPSSGKVTRFYAAGRFSDVRIGDLFQESPSFSTSLTISEVDPLGNYVNVSLGQLPTASDVGWRVVALFEAVQVSTTLQARQIKLVKNTDYTFDATGISILAGIQDTTTPAGPVVEGTVLVSYRALKTSLGDSTLVIASDADAVALGTVSVFNPLAMAVYMARPNTAFDVLATGCDVSQDVKDNVVPFTSSAQLSFSDQLDRIAEEDVYVIALLSQYTGHHTALKTHVVNVSDPDMDFNEVRIGVANAKLVINSDLITETTRATWDVRGKTIVQSYSDASISAKGKRIWSRGVGSFPDFDGSVSPFPVNPSSDLIRLSGGSPSTNDGFHAIESSEILSQSSNRGYVLAYGNRIRSCSHTLTASDSGGVVRLTGANGSFAHLAAEGASPVGLTAKAYLPGAMDGIFCSVDLIDTVNFAFVELDTVWDAGFAGTSLSQLHVDAYDDVFASPGLSTEHEAATVTVALAAGPANTLTYVGALTPFKGMEGLQVEISGAANPGDNDYHTILSVDVTGKIATVSSTLLGSDASVSCHRNLLRVNGLAAAGELASITAEDVGVLRFGGRPFSLTGAKVTGTNDIGGFPADTFGPDDVGTTIRFWEAAGVGEVRTITAFVTDQRVTVDGAVFASNNAITAHAVDLSHESVDIEALFVDAGGDYVYLNKNWSHRWACNNTAHLEIESVGTFGYGDTQRVVRVLEGVYAGQSYVVLVSTPSELILESETAFGSTAGLGANSSAESLNGTSIMFTSTPGNNTLRIKARTVALIEEAGKNYRIERDFREMDITGETFITKGILAGDVLSISAPAAIAGEYVIESVDSETEITLKPTSPLSTAGLIAAFDGGALDSLVYEVYRPKTKSEQAESIKSYAEAVGSRRMILVWPEECYIDVNGTEERLPGYYMCSIIASLVSNLPPQQPLSKYALTGVKRVVKSRIDNYFNLTQHNTIADGGVMIVYQERSSVVPYIRHQLTTDRSSVKFQELSITKNVDFVTRIIKREFGRYTGKYNITPQAISVLRSTGQSIVTFCENQNDPNVGNLVNSLEFDTIEQDTTEVDRVLIEFNGDFPVPMNRIRVRLNA